MMYESTMKTFLSLEANYPALMVIATGSQIFKEAYPRSSSRGLVPNALPAHYCKHTCTQHVVRHIAAGPFIPTVSTLLHMHLTILYSQ